MNKQNFSDSLFDQMTAISKAGAYDVISPEYHRLQKENAELKYTIAQLEIKLKGEQQRVQALKDFINEVRPENVELHQLSETDKEIEQELNKDDIKDIL